MSDARILKVTASTGNITAIAGIGVLGSATNRSHEAPGGIALDQFGNIFIATADKIHKITVSTGIITTVLSLKRVSYVAVDTVDNIYFNNRSTLVKKITASTGIITTIAGGGVLLPSTEQGIVATASKLCLGGVAVDSFGNVYVTEKIYNCIYKITADTGLLTVVAGKYSGNDGNDGYNGDNILARTAYLSELTYITVDEKGDIYFTDFDNNRIRKITASTGIITTVAGRKLMRYHQTGIRCQSNDHDSDGKDALSAQLCEPRGIAVDAVGSVFFCAGYNVRKVTFSGVTPSSAVTSAPSVAPVSSITMSPTAGTTTPSASMPSAPASTPSGVSPTAGTTTPTPSASMPSAPASTPRGVSTTAGTTTPSASMPSATVTSSTTASHITKEMHSILILLSSFLILYLHRGA